MKKLIPLFVIFGCNTNQNYDKSMLPDADPAILSNVNSRGLITCMQIPTPLPPVPMNKDHKVPRTEVYDTNDCIDKEMARKDTNKINNERREKREFDLVIDLEDQDKE
tara:strand:- start:1306 stop:1629 length:324 start_codon:yes stop_codon:yes gene_type:complete